MKSLKEMGTTEWKDHRRSEMPPNDQVQWESPENRLYTLQNAAPGLL